ncbi:MAG: LysR family transcriptional regulator [Actinobacteria bacterium]|nr:LysR family transcriptional regulator [Actinomycetota bacterium]
MDGVESRPLRYFVAVAEELHFGRAAERLGIARPPLSRAIRQLESRLGFELFRRTPRAVTLTPVGEALLVDSRIALAALDAAVRRARRAAEPDRLVVAIKADLDGGILDQIIDLYERQPEASELELKLCGWGEHAQLLHEGRADVALAYRPFEERGLDSELILEEPLMAALPGSHPLAAGSTVSFAELADQPRPDWAQGDEDGVWLGPNRSPGADAGVEGLPQLLKRIELGHLVAVLPTSVAARYPRNQIVFLPMLDAPAAGLSALWPEASRSLAVAAFVRAAVGAGAARTP